MNEPRRRIDQISDASSSRDRGGFDLDTLRERRETATEVERELSRCRRMLDTAETESRGSASVMAADRRRTHEAIDAIGAETGRRHGIGRASVDKLPPA